MLMVPLYPKELEAEGCLVRRRAVTNRCVRNTTGSGHRNVPAGATCYHLARMRYFRTAVPSFATGTMNCAAKAAVFVYL